MSATQSGRFDSTLKEMINGRYLVVTILAISTALVLLGILLIPGWRLHEANSLEQRLILDDKTQTRLAPNPEKAKTPAISRAKISDSSLGSHFLFSDGRDGFIDQDTGKIGSWNAWTPEQKHVLGLDQDMQEEVYESYDNATLENLSEYGDYLAMWHLGRRIVDANPLRAEKLWLDAVAVYGKAGPIITDASPFAQRSRDFDAYMKFEYLAFRFGYANALVREQFMIDELGVERANVAKQQANELLNYIRVRRRELTGKELVLPEPVFYIEPVEVMSQGDTE